MAEIFPVIDLHCDLLGYMERAPGSTAFDIDEIGCAVPHLKAGNVKLQVMAHFTLTEPGCTKAGLRQAEIYRELIEQGVFREWRDNDWENVRGGNEIYILPALENASNFAEEEEELTNAFGRFETIAGITGRPLYLTITHHGENRFGGGNLCETGLKPDGVELLRFLDGRGTAIDMSHTSDRLAADIIEQIDKEGLDLRILASHSNFRPVCDHKRNLTDEIRDEIIRRGGVIGINFVRDFVDPDRPEALVEHIRYGFAHGAEKTLAFGADFFPPAMLPAEYQNRAPFFHAEHEDASKYPAIMAGLGDLGREKLEALAWGNALRFISEK